MSRSLLLFAVGAFSVLLLLADAHGEVGRSGGIVVLPNVQGPIDEDDPPRMRLEYERIEDVTMQVPQPLIGAPVAVEAGLMPVPGIGSLSGRFLTFARSDLVRLFGAGITRLRTSVVDSTGDGLLIDLLPRPNGGMVVEVR